MKQLSLAAIAALLVVGSGVAHAEQHPTWTLSGGGMLVLPDDGDRGAGGGSGFMLGVGRFFGPRFSLDLEFDSYEFDLDAGGDVDVDGLGLMARYHFDVDSEYRPYLGFGAGEADHDGPRGSGDDFMAQVAGGIHFPLRDNLDLRTEVRLRFDADNHTGPRTETLFTDALFTLGLRLALGQTGETPTPVKPAAPTARDSDGDGVNDDSDRCPRTPPGVAVDETGCPLDGDGDGVPDYRDDCPNTPAGARVGANGCQEEMLIELPGVYFDFDKATLKSEARQALADVVKTLGDNDLIHISVEGHTDWVGNDAYNQKLSENRARAVYDHLSSHGVSESRMRWVGYGESRPVMTNDTDEGRARNRRVELRIVD